MLFQFLQGQALLSGPEVDRIVYQCRGFEDRQCTSTPSDLEGLTLRCTDYKRVVQTAETSAQGKALMDVTLVGVKHNFGLDVDGHDRLQQSRVNKAAIADISRVS